ncbi:MAG: hypothetical protein IJT79_08290 [Ruminococcus sp.]|nr:hypothetical protein [Ruminococcus sp.]
MMFSTINKAKALNLFEATKSNQCDWIRIETLKKYLKQENLSLDSINYFKLFLKHLQQKLFIFDCENSYTTVFENQMFVLSKNKFSFDYRLDYLAIENDEPVWKEEKVINSILLRLRNAILVTDFGENNDYQRFIEAISSSNIA